MIAQRRRLREDAGRMLDGFRKWGSGGADTQWLHQAGFTRRNTRRAILSFLDNGLWAGERILHLTSGTYRLQMGYLAITDRRVVFGMSWAFIPFIKRRRGFPLEQIAWARMDRNPWGARLTVGSPYAKAALGDLEDEEAAKLASLVSALARRAKLRTPVPAAGQATAAAATPRAP